MESKNAPEFNYHLLRNALNSFHKNLQELDADEYRQVYRKAAQTYQLESRVLAAPEAVGIVIAEPQLEQALNEVAERYESRADFVADLQANRLDEAALRHALYRELLFDAVMQRVSSNAVSVGDIDIRLFYEMHPEKFTTQEKRAVSHILITINQTYSENTYIAACRRIEEVEQKLKGRTNRFADFAKRYSECPSAMQAGKLGEVVRGQLYPQLDTMLFSMSENRISPVVESEMGFHLLYCEKIKPAKRQPLSKVAGQIREVLQHRQRRNCQKAWLNKLAKA